MNFVFLGGLDERLQTYVLNSFLAWQVKNFGPLWTTSATAFESSHHVLSVKFTGSVNHLELLVERYLKFKRISRTEISDHHLSSFFKRILKLEPSFESQHRMTFSPLMKQFEERGFILKARIKVGSIIYEYESYELS